MNASKGFLGIKWGDDPVAAAAQLGLNCESWEPWEGGRGYEACFDTDHPVGAFGHQAYVRLFRSKNRLEGLSLRFVRCGAARDELSNAVRREFNLKATAGTLYEVFGDGAVVHLDYDSGDDTCELTVTGPQFGDAFAAYLLGRGFKELSSGLRVR